MPRGGGKHAQEPVLLRKGTTVLLSLFSMHRRQDIYGEDTNEFRPERWRNLSPGWAFLPFSAGPRVCLGREFLDISQLDFLKNID